MSRGGHVAGDTGGQGLMRGGVPSTPDVLVVIPARDEEKTIAAVVRSVRQAGFDVLVVDDDSGDGTAGEASGAGATVLSAPLNLGAWLATQTWSPAQSRSR